MKWGWILSRLWRLYLPRIVVEENLPKRFSYLQNVAGFDPESNTIYMRKGNENWGVMTHEFGHWAIYRLGLALNALWEIPWWVFGLRRLFVRPPG